MRLSKDYYSISVIIPMYNSQDTIERAIMSIYNQTASSFICEIIVVNDGSTDSSLEVLEKIKTKNNIAIKIINKENGGVSTARNAGMKEANGNWIALLDSDDMWFNNKIEEQLQILDKNKEIDFLSCNMDDKPVRILNKEINTLYKVSVQDLCLKMLSQPSTVIFKRKIFREIGGFDEKQRYAEDGNYFLHICNKYNYYHYPLQVINYGYGKEGFGVSGLSKNLKEMYKGNVKNLKDIRHEKIISRTFYFNMRIFHFLKYIRRIVLTKGRNIS